MGWNGCPPSRPQLANRKFQIPVNLPVAASRNEKEKSLQGETYRRHSKCNEAGASFNTDLSSDERQMHLNAVKCSN
ncbi:hypothetical protein TNCV_3336621 [Trichonephila clavipes]|nr:hypothetical protein TNCV_3336621 [Trichonephila clavipes]